MSEGQRQNTKDGYQRERVSHQKRVIIPQTPDVLQHKSRPRGRSRSRQGSVSDGTTKSQSVTKTGSAQSNRKWYTDGFPALRVAEKKIRDIRARQEKGRLADDVNKKKRSRSYSRGRSVYSHDSDQPYYRSKSVDRAYQRQPSFVPVTNEDDVINITYTGRSSRENSMDLASRSSRRGSLSRRGSGIVLKKVESVVPYMRDTYEFDDLQTRIYQQIQKLYGQSDNHVKHKQFFTTFGQVQSDHKRINKMNINEDDKKFLEKMFQAFQQLNVETGKILKNSSERYSSRNKQHSPLNEKVRLLPTSHRNEDFLTKLPKTKDTLKLRSLKHVHRHNRNQLKGPRTFQNYSDYDFDAGNKIASFQKVKESSDPSNMLKFLQRAERMLTLYNEERLSKSPKIRSANHRHLPEPLSRTTRPSSMVNLNRGRKSSSRIARVYENHKDGAPFGRLSPLKRNTKRLSTLEEKKPESSGYARPEVFYNPRVHVYHNDRTRLLEHRLNQSRQNEQYV